MKKQALDRHMPIYLLLMPLLVLVGCDNEKKESGSSINDGSTVLVTLNDRPVVTMNSFDDEFQTYMNANPQAQQMLALMPDIRRQFLEGVVSQVVVDEYVHRNKLDQTPEYKKERERILVQVDRALNTRLFMDQMNIQVSEQDVRKFYDENREMIPELMISQGGVKAEGVSFADEDAAKQFLSEVKGRQKDSLETLANETGNKQNYRDFKMVNGRSAGVDAVLRTKIMQVTNTPSDQLIHDGSRWWVVRAHSKEEAKFHPFEQVKAGLAEHLKKMREAEELQKRIGQLKDEYGIKINDEPLRPAEQPAKTAALDTVAPRTDTVVA